MKNKFTLFLFSALALCGSLFSADVCVVVFDANGGRFSDGSSSSQSSTLYSRSATVGSSYGKLPTPTAFDSTEGMDFGGWYTKDGLQILEESTVLDPGDGVIHLYANWLSESDGGETDSKTVSLRVYGLADGLSRVFFGSVDLRYGGYDNQICTVQSQSDRLSGIVLPGYVRDDSSWLASVVEDCSFAAGSSYYECSEFQAVSPSWKSIAVRFTPRSYVVTFDGGSVTPSFSSKTVTYGQPYGELPTVNAGWDFSGWKTSLESSGTLVTADTVVTTPFDHKLYAAASAQSHSLRVLPGFAGGVAFEKSYSTSTSAQTVPVTLPTNLGHSVSAWIEGGYRHGSAPSLTTNSATSGTVSIPANSYGALSFTPVWTANPYEVKFHANDGTDATSSQSFVYGVEQELASNSFVRGGYEFGGWTNAFGHSYADGVPVRDLTCENGGVVDMYAKWTANPYEVKFHANYGTDATSPQSFVYGVEQGLSSNSFVRGGYEFGGWTNTFGHSYADGVSVRDLTCENGGVVDMYAKWNPLDYVVTNAFDGKQVANYSTAETDQTFTVSYVPSRIGYHVVGWECGDDAPSGVKCAKDKLTIPADAYGDFTMTANFTPNAYTVHFEKNADVAAGEMQPQSFVYDVSQALTSNAYSRAGYDFTGWTNSAGVAYADGASVTNLTTENNGVVTLYAVWASKEYKVISDYFSEDDSTVTNCYVSGHATNMAIQLYNPGSYGSWAVECYYAVPISESYSTNAPPRVYNIDNDRKTGQLCIATNTYGDFQMYAKYENHGLIRVINSEGEKVTDEFYAYGEQPDTILVNRDVVKIVNISAYAIEENGLLSTNMGPCDVTGKLEDKTLKLTLPTDFKYELIIELVEGNSSNEE